MLDKLWGFATGEKPTQAGKSSTPDADLSASRADLSALKSSGATSRPTERRARSGSKAEERIKEIQLAETLERLYEPKNFKPVGKLYFNIRYGVTGWEGFLLTPPEEESVAAAFAMVTEALWLWDPRLLAVVVAAGTIGSVIAEKEMRYYKTQVEPKKAAATDGQIRR